MGKSVGELFTEYREIGPHFGLMVVEKGALGDNCLER